MAARVILLHGLWMRGFAMALLRHRLHEDGYDVETFDYLSVAAPLDRAVQRLRERMLAGEGTTHLVGHSLGGVLALLAARDESVPARGRIVCLGSPLRGSAAAQHLTDHGGAWLLGHSRDLLEHGLQRWDGPQQVGVVAGSLPLGLGNLFAGFDGDHDGTVAVAETRLPGIAAHCTVEASHTGLLFSSEAATETLAFLRQGVFGSGD